MIDVSVGRGGELAATDGFQDPDFEKDSARIYLSQKCNLDRYFGLRSTTGAPNIDMSSGIGIKADVVRIIGREGIRLVTRTETKNSLGGGIKTIHGIDLCAGNG